MKLIEILKEKKLSKKKVDSIIVDILKYSSITSYEKPAFNTIDEQKKHVSSLIQSGMDLLKRRAVVKVLIDKTNINTKIKIPKGIIMPSEEISLAEALMFKLNYGEYLKLFQALSTSGAEKKLQYSNMNNSDGTKAIPIQLYDENFKINWLNDLMMKLQHIDSHLEMINAITDVDEN